MNETRKERLITLERYTRINGQSVTLIEAYDSTHVAIYQRKATTFCSEDFGREQEHNEMDWNSCRRAHPFKWEVKAVAVVKPPMFRDAGSKAKRSDPEMEWQCLAIVAYSAMS